MTAGKSALADAIDMVRSRFSRERMGGRVARGSLQTILVNGTGAAASFLVQLGLSNSLGKDAFGTYLLVMGWLYIAQLCGKLELDVTSVRFIGSYVATERWGFVHGYLRGSRRVVIAMSIAVSIIGALLAFLLDDALRAKNPALPETVLVACLMVPIVTMLMLEGAVLQGLQRYAMAQLPLNLIRPIALGLSIIVIVFVVGRTMTPPIAVAANTVSTALALFITWRWRRRELPPQVRAATPEYDGRTWAKTAYPLFAVSMSQVVISQQADVIVVGVMLTTAQAGVYGAASQLTMPLMLAASSVTFVAQSMIADLYSRDPARLQSLIRAVTWLAAALAVPIAVVLIGIGRPLLSLYGEGFTEGYPVLVLLTLAQLVVGVVGALAGYLLTMTAHERQAAWIIGLTAAFNLVLALLLTPNFGPVGTASATLAAALLRVLALRIYIKRSMGLRVPAFRA